jgi:hypothetical protein
VEVDDEAGWNEVESIAADADTLLKVDIVRLDTLTDTVFKQRIAKEGLLLHELIALRANFKELTSNIEH